MSQGYPSEKRAVSEPVKVCFGCGAEKCLSEFYSDKTKKFGKSSRCKACSHKATVEWCRLHHAEVLERAAKYRSANRARLIVAGARARAKKRGIKFDLTATDIQLRLDKGICELTGTALDLSPGKRKFNTPSLDRIIPAEGYVTSNVRIICDAINMAMGDWGEATLLTLIKNWFSKLQNAT